MTSRFLLLSALLVTVTALEFSSDSSSCEDDDGHHHGGHGNGRGGGANRGCPNGWRRFNRPTGGWCMKVFSTGSTQWDYRVAAATCQRNNAVMSGIQDSNEMHYISDTAVSTIGGTGSIWIGARRTGTCMRQKQTARCTQTTSFSWVDSSTTGTAGFSWLAKNQPDNAHGLEQNCVVLFFAASTTVYKNVNWWPGALDDTSCSTAQFAKTGPRLLKGFVCGRAASN